MNLKPDQHVSKTIARAFKGHLLDLILVEWLVDNRSVTSALPFVCNTLHEHMVSAVDTLLYLHCRAFLSKQWRFLTWVFLSMYKTNMMIFSSWYRHRIDFSFLLLTSFNSFGISFLSWHMVPTIANFFSKTQSVKDTDIDPWKRCPLECYCNWTARLQDTSYIRLCQWYSILLLYRRQL